MSYYSLLNVNILMASMECQPSEMIVQCFRFISILVMADFGDVLMEFEEKSSKTKQLEVLKNDVKLLKRKRAALLQREVQFRSDINAGSMKSPDRYKLPLSVVQPVVQGQVLNVKE